MTFVRLTGLPSHLPLDWLSWLLIRHPFVAASVSFFPISKESSVAMADRFILNVSSAVIDRIHTGRASDDLDKMLDQARALADDIRFDTTRLYYASIVLCVVSSSPWETDGLLDLLTSDLRANSILYTIQKCRQIGELSEFSLCSSPSFDHCPLITSQSLPSFVPFTQSPVLQAGGTLIGQNAIDGTVVSFDRFSCLNFNGLVIGKSGSGKSFFTKMLLLRESGRGDRFYVIDPLGEFFSVGMYAGGAVVDVCREGIGLGSIPLGEFLPLVHSFIRFVKAVMNLTDSESTLLQTEIERSAVATPEMSLYSFLGTLDCCAAGGTRNLKVAFSEPAIGFVFRGEFALSPEARTVILNLEGIEKGLMRHTINLLAGIVFESCRNTSGRKTLVIDEAWVLSRDAESASIITEITRHSRHYNMSVLLVSQNYDDFMGSSHGESIVNNCSSFFVFRHERLSEKMSTFFELNEGDIEFLSTSVPRRDGVGRCLFVTSGMKLPLLITPIRSERHLCSSEQAAALTPAGLDCRLALSSLDEAVGYLEKGW